MKTNKVKKKIKINAYMVIVGAILILYTLSIFFSLAFGVLNSLKHFADTNLFGLPEMSYWNAFKDRLASLNPDNPADVAFYEMFAGYDNIFANYVTVIKKMTINDPKTYFIGFDLNNPVTKDTNGSLLGIISNTILYACGTAFFSAFAPCVAGYLCSKFNYKFSGFIYAFVLTVMAMPIVGNATAVLTLMQRLSMYNTIWGMWIKSFSFLNSYFLIYFAFFKGVSNTYAEAAQIDGASYFKIMWKIYIPLASKIVSTVFLLQFVALYNDYNSSLIYMPSYPTLTYAILRLSNSDTGTFGWMPTRMAMSIFLCLPILTIFIVFKNKLMGNISLGGVKE